MGLEITKLSKNMVKNYVLYTFWWIRERNYLFHQ